MLNTIDLQQAAAGQELLCPVSGTAEVVEKQDDGYQILQFTDGNGRDLHRSQGA